MTLKIALVDNMNNNFFAIARYMRDLGVVAHLYLIPGSSHAHFHPQSDTFENVSAMDWVREFPAPYKPRALAAARRLRKQFANYDLVVTCGSAAGLLHWAGVRTDVFIPYGGDLFDTPYVERQRTRVQGPVSMARYLLWSRPLAQIQCAGIRESRLVIYNENWEAAAQAVKRIGAFGLSLPRLMVYNREKFTQSERWDFLRKHDFVLFSQARQYWCSDLDQLHDFAEHGGLKRNDKLIRAFARSLANCPFKSPILVLFEFGPDVEASKRLVQDCGIAERVVWAPMMDRKSIMSGLRFASLGADQFRHGWSGTSGGTGSEIMAAGVPLMTNTNGATTDPSDPFYQAPIIDVLEEQQIHGVLLDYWNNPSKYTALGTEAGRWFEANLGSGLARNYLRVFEYLVADRSKRVDLATLKSFLAGSDDVLAKGRACI
jgi:hypothetical protein